MDNNLHSEEEKDGIVCLWKGFHSDIKIQTYDAFAHKIIKRISLGFEHGIFLSTEKEVFVVGSNSHHQLGLGNLKEPSIDSPRLLDYFTGKDIIEIACGKAYSAVISASGDAYMWGDSSSGQCGVGRKEDVLTPELVSFSIQEDKCKHGVPLPEEKIHVRKVACGHTHTLAITNRGELWAWGSGMGLGLGDKKESLVPERVPELSDSNVLDIACGMAHSVALVEKHGHVMTPRKSISDMKYHKFYPPTCAKCNQEIYSYIETNDLCIISDEHTCTKKVEKKSTPKANEDTKSEQTSSVTSSPLKSEQVSSVASSPLKSEQVSSVASSPLKSEQVSSVASSPLKSEQVSSVASSPLKSEQVSSVASSPLKSEQVSSVASSPLKSEQVSSVASSPLKSEQVSSVSSSPLKSEQVSNVASSPLKCEQVSNVASSPLKSEQVSSVASSPLKCEQVSNVASSPLKCEQVSSVASSPLKCEQVSSVTSSPLKCEQVSSATSSPLKCEQVSSVTSNPLKCEPVSSTTSNFLKTEQTTSKTSSLVKSDQVSSATSNSLKCDPLPNITSSPLTHEVVTSINSNSVKSQQTLNKTCSPSKKEQVLSVSSSNNKETSGNVSSTPQNNSVSNIASKNEETSVKVSSPSKMEQVSSVASNPIKNEQKLTKSSNLSENEQTPNAVPSPSKETVNITHNHSKSLPSKPTQLSKENLDNSKDSSSPLKEESPKTSSPSPEKAVKKNETSPSVPDSSSASCIKETPVAATDLNQSATLSPSPTVTRLSDNQTDSISLKDEGDSTSQDQSYSQSSHMSTSSTTEDIVQKNKSHILDEEEAREYLAKQMNDQDANGGDPSCQHPIKTRLENLFTSVPETSVAVVQQVTDLTNRAISTFRSSVGSMADSFGFVSGQHIDLDGLSKSSSLDSNLHSDTDSPSMSRRDSVFTYDSPLSEDMWRRRSGSNDDALSDRTDSHSSLRALWRRSKKLEKERQSHKKDDKSSTSSPHLEPLPYFETEVWSWGKNSKGQLGLGDTIDREKPCCIRILNSKNSTKIIAGPQHCLALTAYSQVYSWGSNSHGQLGYTESSNVPSPVKFVANCLVWDIAAGENHSLFLTDSGGFHPDVYYSGKHPSDNKTTYSSMIKTTKPVALNSLRKSGWIRSLVAGGSTCACLVGKSSSGQTATAFELALSERNFYFHLNKIASKFLKPLKTSVFFCSMDVNPYKPTFNNLVESFLHLTNKIGENCVELTRLIRGNEDITQCHMFQQSNNLLKVFKNYSHCFGDMAAINGFEFCAKLGSSYFEKIQIVFADILDETNTEKINFASALQRIMQYPLRRLKEYGHMADKLSMGYPLDSEMRSFLSGISIAWDSLKLASNEEHKQADITRLFWEASTQRLVESLRTPERRLLRDTKQHPLTQASAGRFSVHNFLLFNDIFVHVHGSSITIFPLETVWVDTSTEIEQTQDTLVIIVPEDIFVLTAASLASKAEWLMELNQAINNCYRPPRSASVSGSSRVEANRLTPPLVRQAQYKFSKHAIFKDATYNGTWMKAKIHGHGEMKWLDGRRYIGKFINGLQHGNGKYIVPKGECEEIYEGSWKDGKMNGLGSVIYPNGDRYDGYFKDGQKFGHGVLRQGKHLASVASVYIGEWTADKRCGYGVLDDVLRGEKYMGLWQDDNRHGNGIVVTLDGMYFEGNFVQGKLSGFGLMLTDDDSCYEGEFSGITQLNGKGTLRLPNGDRIDGHFSGSWNEGLKVNGTFHKGMAQDSLKKTGHVCGIQSKTYGSLSVTADRKWEDIFSHCKAMLGYTGEGKADTGKAWESVAVMITRGKKTLNDREFNSPSKMRMMSSTLEELEKIPPYSEGKMTLEYYHKIARYLAMAFDTKFHPIGKLIDGLVDVFRAAYIGIGAHPRLLPHAVQEIKSYVKRIYKVIRILFPDLPASSKPVRIYSIKTPPPPADENESVIEQDFMTNNEKHDSEVVTPALLLHPLLLPKIYPPLFDLYALFNDKEDEKYWERVQKLNRQGDMALMAYLGIDQRFWLIEDNLFQGNRQKLSEIRDHCYASAVEMLQQISTAFSPCEKLAVIRRTFLEITKAVQITLGNDYIWCMDDLFPIFQYVVVRSKIQHLGAEIHLIDDLMERHLEHGELGIMFTTLKACYFQIQHEKMPT